MNESLNVESTIADIKQQLAPAMNRLAEIIAMTNENISSTNPSRTVESSNNTEFNSIMKLAGLKK